MGSKLRAIGAVADAPTEITGTRSNCLGKQRFETMATAMLVCTRSNQARRFGTKNREAREAYHCRWCGGFHIGSRVPRLEGGRAFRGYDPATSRPLS